MGTLKDRPCPNGEVQFAGIAAVEAILAGRDSLFRLALRALDAMLPQTALKIFAGGWLIGEEVEELEGADCAFAHLRLPITDAQSLSLFD
jgi:hypothetical protein